MTDRYDIRVELNPKPIPDRKVDWDCWFPDDPEFGTEHGATAVEALRHMADRLEMGSPWIVIGRLTPDGPVFDADPEFPTEGETVLVREQSMLGVHYTLHTHTNERGRWHWPSFGVAWMRIPL